MTFRALPVGCSDVYAEISFSAIRLIALRRMELPSRSAAANRSRQTEDVLAYLRRSRAGEDDYMIVLNLDSRSCSFSLPETAHSGTVALSTHRDRDGERAEGELQLRADEGVIVRVSTPQVPAW